MRIAERFEDMSQRGRLRLIQQDDGDVAVVVIEDPNSNGCCAGLPAIVEFCTSGGKSPKLLLALINLMEVIKEENLENLTSSRRGEVGLGSIHAVKEL